MIVMLEIKPPVRWRPKRERFGVFNRWIWLWFSVVYLPGLGINDMREAYRQADRDEKASAGVMKHTVMCACGESATSKIENGEMSLSPMAGWHFSVETGWCCPKCAAQEE